LHTQLSKAEEAGDKAAIIELSRRIVAIAPNDSDAWETLAQTQLDIEDLDRLAQTLDAWQKVRRPPAAIEDFRGDLCLKRKDYQNAERHWLAFLATKPRAADAATEYDKLADCMRDAGALGRQRGLSDEGNRGGGFGRASCLPRMRFHASA